MRTLLVLAVAMPACALLAAVRLAEVPHEVSSQAVQQSPLPKIGPAPGFALTSQDGAQVSLSDLHGKVVAVTFIFTRCSDTCPVLTPMMSLVQDRLGDDFGPKVVFASITVDPEHDTPEMLKLYAQMHGADVAGWSFLTGPPPIILELARRYGVFAAKNANGDVEHSFLTSIVDRRGILRVPASAREDRPALLGLGRPPLSRSGLLDQIAAVSRSLAAAGVRSGDRVAICIPDGPEMATAFLGVCAVAASAPLNPAYREEEFAFFLSDLQPRALVLPAGSESPARAAAALFCASCARRCHCRRIDDVF